MNNSNEVRQLILELLTPKLKSVGYSINDIDDTTDLMTLGILDSLDLLDMMLVIEEKTGFQFCPENADLDHGLTIESFVSAFSPACPR